MNHDRITNDATVLNAPPRIRRVQIRGGGFDGAFATWRFTAVRYAAIELRLMTLILLWLVLPGCSTTFVTSSWKDPSLTEPLHFNKIAARAVQDDGTIRRVVEDEMARQIGPRAVAAYTILTEEDRKDVDRIKTRLQAAGVAGAVTIELQGKRSETFYGGGGRAGGFQESSTFPHADATDLHKHWDSPQDDVPVNDPQTNTILLIDTRIY